METEFDLFGMPVDPRTGLPGRPRKRATAVDRNVIKGLLADGKTVAEMSIVMRMSEPTFRKVFFRELQERHAWRLRIRGQVISTLMEEALEKKNMSAMRQLRAELDRMERFDIERKFGEPADQNAAEPALGKKQVAAQLAAEADAELMSELEEEAGRIARH